MSVSGLAICCSSVQLVSSVFMGDARDDNDIRIEYVILVIFSGQQCSCLKIVIAE